MKNTLSIKSQIQSATSIEEVNQLLLEIKRYTKAHPSTVRKCGRASKEKIKELGV
jgi:hypothetical protein